MDYSNVADINQLQMKKPNWIGQVSFLIIVWNNWQKREQKSEIVNFMALTLDRPEHILPELDQTETIDNQPTWTSFRYNKNMKMPCNKYNNIICMLFRENDHSKMQFENERHMLLLLFFF